MGNEFFLQICSFSATVITSLINKQFIAATTLDGVLKIHTHECMILGPVYFCQTISNTFISLFNTFIV